MLGIFLRVKRQGRVMLGETAHVGVAGLLFLQVGRIRQQNLAQGLGGLAAIDLAAETVLDQQRQIAGMVDMRVRQHNGIDGRRVYRQFRPVLQTQLLQTLKQSAINQHMLVVAGDQVLGAGNGTGRAEECDFHA